MKKVWRVKRKGLFVTLLIVLFVALSLPVMVKAEGATVWTDKGDYAPGETVTIYGSGFNPEAQVTITVTRPDGTMDEWAITSNSSGALTTTYLLDGITGTYTVTATDGTNTVTTTFTDVPPTPTTSTISFSPSSPVTAGTTVTITGTVTVTSSGNPVTSGTIHIDEYKLGGVGVPYPTTGADWDTIDSGTPDTYGEFSTDFDTTGLGGKTIGFRSHYIPAGGTGYAESKSDPSNLVISAAFVSFKVSGHKTEYGGSGLSGWTIQLFKDTWVTPYATTTTAATTGYYEFTITEPGDYRIYEDVQSGWTEVTPSAGYYEFTATSGHADITDQNFVNFEWLTVSGHKYLSGTTTGVSGWHIQLYKGAVQYGSDAVTDANGAYSFTVKDPGTYAIKEVLKDKWTETSPVLTYSPGDGSTPSVLGYTFTAESGVDMPNQDFWNFQWLTVSGHKYEDTDGTKPTDSPLEDWTINLYKDSTLYDSTTTAADGSYSFTVKEPGTYHIWEVLPTGWTATSPTYQVGPASGTVEVEGYSFTAESGVNVEDQDFWNFEWATVSGTKSEYGGSGLSGWTIKAVDGLKVYSATTAGDGSYSITVKEPGTYDIKEVLKGGWTMTSPSLYVGSGSDEDVTGYADVSIGSGDAITDKDFENFEWLTISGVKFFDANGNGNKESGEPELQYWDIKLYMGSTLYGSATTASDGSYSFTVKDPGTYSIKEVLKNQWWETTPESEGPGDGSTEVLGYSDITVESGVNIADKDFGNWLGSKSFVSTSSLCWFDMNPSTTDTREFKLIFTPDVPDHPTLWRLTASNPGQFYYNVFYTGSGSTSFTINIPYPFVTQGAVPIHVYSSLNTGPDGCLIPGTDITSQFTISKSTILFEDWTGKTFGDTIPITISGPSSGFLYINIHLDYGLKKNINNLGKNGLNDATDPTGATIKIGNGGSYDFSVSGAVIDTQTIYNMNVFKRDPGFGGLVTDSNGNPIQGVKVQIYGPDGKLLATVYTDEDGWYQYNYKHTGKAATFTIKLPDYGQSKSVTVKANSFALVNFQI